MSIFAYTNDELSRLYKYGVGPCEWRQMRSRLELERRTLAARLEQAFADAPELDVDLAAERHADGAAIAPARGRCYILRKAPV